MQRADAMVSDGLLASAPETLEDTIAYLGRTYGGAAGYARAVGLNADEARRTRSLGSGWTDGAPHQKISFRLDEVRRARRLA